MENCQQLAEPLALAVSNSLKKQEVEVNQAVLTSYLLDIHPDDTWHTADRTYSRPVA